jgi:hypothetical protein
MGHLSSSELAGPDALCHEPGWTYGCSSCWRSRWSRFLLGGVWGLARERENKMDASRGSACVNRCFHLLIILLEHPTASASCSTDQLGCCWSNVYRWARLQTQSTSIRPSFSQDQKDAHRFSVSQRRKRGQCCFYSLAFFFQLSR